MAQKDKSTYKTDKDDAISTNTIGKLAVTLDNLFEDLVDSVTWYDEGGSASVASFRCESGQSAISTSDIFIEWDTEDIKDADFTHSTTTNNSRIELGSDARYQVNGCLNYYGTTTNYRTTFEVSWRLNGSTLSNQKFTGGYIRSTGGANESQVPFSFIVDASASDYIEVTSKRLSSAAGDATILSGTNIHVIKL